MITKKALLEEIDALTLQIWSQNDRIRNLEEEVFGSKEKAIKVSLGKKNKKEKALKKAIKSVTKQPRTKDGKFAKKN